MASDLPPQPEAGITPTPPAPGFFSAPPAPSIESTKDERTMAMFAHLGGILAGFIVPLIIWVIKKDESKFVDYHGKEALNFQLNILVYILVSIALICVVVGIFTLIAVSVYGLVMAIIAGLSANKGEMYRYPLTIRVIN